MTHVGNDIVDLTDHYARGKSQDTRFLNRVLTQNELGCLMDTDDPDRLLWAFWSAKETAYKAISKAYPDVSSSPKRYDVTFDNNTITVTSGNVQTPHGTVQVLAISGEDHVHCVGMSKNVDMSTNIKHGMYYIGDDLGSSLPELAKTESRMAREAATISIASHFMLDPMAINIMRPETSQRNTPPDVYINGEKTDIDISLSHDGRFVAYAFSV